MKKKLKSQSQPDNASPPETDTVTSKSRTPRSKSNLSYEPISQRRSSPRFKKPAEQTDPRSTTQTPKCTQPETTIPPPDDTNNSETRSSPRFKESAQPTISKLPLPSRKKVVSKNKNV
ncbi:hypothetical protein MKX03_034931, partial [Papaver bracteatum]